MAEQRILLEAIAPATFLYQFLLERLEVQAHRPPQERIEVFERDRECVMQMYPAQRVEIWFA